MFFKLRATAVFVSGSDRSLGGGELRLADKQRLRGERRAVEALGESEQRLVALRRHLGDDLGDQIAHAGFRQGAAVEAADKRRVAGIEVTENLHAGWRWRTMIADPPVRQA